MLAFVAAAALPGIATAQESAKSIVEIKVPGLPNPASASPRDVALQRVVDTFLKEHPHIRLARAEGISIENVVAEATTIMMVAGGIAPDVVQMNFRSIDSFVSQGIVQPLDAFLEKEPGGIEQQLSSIHPQVRKAIFRVGPNGERHVYAIPSTPVVMGLQYNKDLFRKAGLPDRAPETWDEMLQFARQLREKFGSEVDPVRLSTGSTAGWNLVNFIWSAGGQIVEEVAPSEWRACFNGPDTVEAYLFYYQLVEAERLAVRSREFGPRVWPRTGMQFGYVGEVVNFDPQTTGFGAVPKGPTGLRGSEINCPLYGLYAGIKDPAKRQAAWEYIRFINSERAERIRTETFVELGQAALVSPVALDKFGFGQYLMLAPKGFRDEVEVAMKNAQPEPYGKNCNLVYAEISYPADQILLNPQIAENWRRGDLEAVRDQIAVILDRAVEKTNERMIGYVPPDEMQKRRVVAGVVAALVFSAFAGLGIFIVRSFSQAGSMGGRPVAAASIWPWLILAPAIGLVFVWSYVPLARGTVMAFQDYKVMLPSAFVGLDNFANVLFDGVFWNSVKVTLIYAAYTLTLGFFAPILLAYGLHVIPRWKVTFRLLYYLPAVLTAASVFFLWYELFAAEGILNQFLRLIGIQVDRAWTEDPSLAMLSCVLPGIWAHAGPGCLIYLAALKTIPIEQFEAAEIDGAGFRQKTRLIVWPGLKALIIINFIGAVAAAFHGATNILIMTGGGPNRATEVTSLLIFFEAFTRLRFGTATAMAWLIASMLIGFTVVQLQRMTRMEFKTAK